MERERERESVQFSSVADPAGLYQKLISDWLRPTGSLINLSSWAFPCVSWPFSHQRMAPLPHVECFGEPERGRHTHLGGS